MPYTREYLLRRIIEVQDIVLRNNAKGITQRHTYLTEIEPQYHISYSCFNNWLGIPARRQLEEIRKRKAEDERREPDLFEE